MTAKNAVYELWQQRMLTAVALKENMTAKNEMKEIWQQNLVKELWPSRRRNDGNMTDKNAVIEIWHYNCWWKYDHQECSDGILTAKNAVMGMITKNAAI